MKINFPAPIVLFVTLTAASASGIQNDIATRLIPQPVEIEPSPGHFTIKPDTRILYERAGAKPAAELLGEHLAQITGRPLPISLLESPAPANSIRLDFIDGFNPRGPEHYQIEVTPTAATLRAPAGGGLIHATQTIRQLLPTETSGSQADTSTGWQLPCGTIDDSPRFAWRGLMLDCSRTFQPLDYLRATIDRMAFYKLNVLHLHLTDDQGWRIEIRSHPELTAKGARFPDKWKQSPDQHGFYSQAQLKDLVAYAAARNITIVPEIEMPGHTLAVLACYPHLSCTGGPFEIHPFFEGPGIHKDIFCAGNDEVFSFLDEVIGEVCEIFPSEFIHIGGDEAPKERWKKCDKCQARIQQEKLADEHQLQSWFIKQAAAMLAKRDRKLIGWDEILEGGLAPGAAVMSWRGSKGGIAAATAGHPVVMSPNTHCYFDYTYKRIDTRRAYSFEPLAGLREQEHSRNVLGIQANFWSHIDREPEKVDAQLFPRLLAIAERAWSSPTTNADWDDFAARARHHLTHLKAMGVTCHPDPLAPADTHGGK